jgi:hypothetical protein
VQGFGAGPRAVASATFQGCSRTAVAVHSGELRFGRTFIQIEAGGS